MAQRWLAAVCLHGEHGFRKVKSYRAIAEVLRNNEAEQAADQQDKPAAKYQRPRATISSTKNLITSFGRTIPLSSVGLSDLLFITMRKCQHSGP